MHLLQNTNIDFMKYRKFWIVLSFIMVLAGVGAVHPLAACTYARADDFFSYRGSRARKEPDYGRQISAIVLT